jgi:hypothetical protein
LNLYQKGSTPELLRSEIGLSAYEVFLVGPPLIQGLLSIFYFTYVNEKDRTLLQEYLDSFDRRKFYPAPIQVRSATSKIPSFTM